jgi:hypothetical protein
MILRRAHVLPSLLLTLSLVAGCSDSVEGEPPLDDTGADSVASDDTSADTNVEETTAETGEETSANAADDVTDSAEDSTTDSIADSDSDSGSGSDSDSDSGSDSVSDSDSGSDSVSDSASDVVDTAPECTVGTDCPGSDTECAVRTCTLGVCGVSNLPASTVLTQTAGDCKVRKCDGAGAVTNVADDSDLPDDGNACTQDLCSAGTISHPPTLAGSACSDGSKTKCNGAGVCVECVDASTCPGTDTDCNKRSCTAGVCGFSPVSSGTATSTQVPGDCKQVQCNGSGGTTNANDDTDVPDDGNACTDDKCSGGVATHLAYSSPHTCGGGKICNGTACVECIVASDCSGTDTDCSKRACNSGVCGTSYPIAGTPLSTQTAGDCLLATCDGAGGTTTASATSDVPADDGNPCTDEVCSALGPAHPFSTKGTACSTATITGGKCDGAGTCAQCVSDSDCSGGTECSAATCSAGTCTLTPLPNGTVLATQTTGDCVERQCDGAGNVTSVAAGTDVPADDGNQCTDETCSGTTPSHPNSASGTACTSGGSVCDGSGACVECLAGTSCASGVCSPSHTCAAASCTDTVKNGSETDVDCGGGTCGTCALGKTCSVGSDCASTNCVGGVCAVNHLVISELKTRGTSSALDEFVEIYNPTAAAVTFDSTWTITNRSNTAGSYGLRYTGTGISIPSLGHLLLVGSSYTGTTTGDATLVTGIGDAGSLLLNKSGVVIDALCFGYDTATKTTVTGTGYICEGSPATSFSTAGDRSVERTPNYQDTDANSVDFTTSSPSTPQATGSPTSP